MASVAGALRAYLRAKGDNVGTTSDVRVMVPVNLRKPSRRKSWATPSAWCRWCCRWAWKIRSARCTKCATA